ncbi:ATP synthase subunit f, mitochondrial [Beauveria bassiana]|uniref:ATP synthase subunit f, mitochondrial n=1 Tax=Beauveria bassiana TaxID=176275 RepID=A0A2N6NXH7_BEABA|nr:ATP synthase subunit f, mitochondrial [Beauveria bassiana]
MSFVTRRGLSTLIPPKAIGGAPDALRMQRVVSFYEKLPRGAAPEAKAKGLLGRYQARYFGKKASATRMDTCSRMRPSCEKRRSYEGRLS